MMRKIRFPDDERSRVEVEPGVLWLELEDELRSSHRALTVYPTSAPRATVGGWIARDGMGVGSFAYGWLRENILSAEVSLPDGRLRTLEGDDLERISRWLIGQWITTVGKPAQCVPATDRIERLSYGFHQSLLRAGLEAA